MSRRVVVTGMGLVSPLGDDVSSFWRSLIEKKSGIGFLPDEYRACMRVQLGAFSTSNLSKWISASQRNTLDRTAQLALSAAIQASEDAGLHVLLENAQKAGVYVGTGAGSMATVEQSIMATCRAADKRSRPLTVVMGMQNAAAAQIGLHHHFHGPVFTFSTACSSSSIAIGEAFRAIQSGHIDVALTGGTESGMTLSMMKAWDAMGALAETDVNEPHASMKPFSERRSGFVMGEGAAMLVLEERDRAIARGVRIHAEVLGYATGNDAFHIAKPNADGEVRVMEAALADAGLVPEAIDYINAHGTATVAGDEAEAAAIHAVFGRRSRPVPVSSTKALHGHLIGASGALELIATILSTQHGLVPPTAHVDSAAPGIAIDIVPGEARAVNVDVAMSNSFAFGGSNAVLIVGRP
jgi:3-oxoacyl-[acyl-carrier-protein] synthase II